MNYEALIFDLDGTLVNSLGDITFSLNQTLEEYGFTYRYTNEETKYLTGSGARVIVERALKPFNVSPNEVYNIYQTYLTNYHNNSQTEFSTIYPGVLNFLRFLKANNIKTYVLTNKPQEIAERVINYFFEDLFIEVVGNVPGVPVKPDPTSLNNLLHRYNIAHDKALFIGDTEIDLQVANNAKIASCWVSYGFRHKNDVSHVPHLYEVSHPDEILQFIS